MNFNCYLFTAKGGFAKRLWPNKVINYKFLSLNPGLAYLRFEQLAPRDHCNTSPSKMDEQFMQVTLHVLSVTLNVMKCSMMVSDNNNPIVSNLLLWK